MENVNISAIGCVRCCDSIICCFASSRAQKAFKKKLKLLTFRLLIGSFVSEWIKFMIWHFSLFEWMAPIDTRNEATVIMHSGYEYSFEVCTVGKFR